MRVSLGGFLVALGWLTFARAAYNVTVDHSDTSQLTYLPVSAWAEVELEAEDSTIVIQCNGTATMSPTIGAQVSLMFKGTAIYWLGYGTSNSSQFVEFIIDDVTVMVDVSSAGFGTTHLGVAFFRPNLRMDKVHNITVRTIENDDSSAVLYHVGFIYTAPIEAHTTLENGATSAPQPMTTPDDQPMATPTTNGAERTFGPSKRNQVVVIIVIGVLVGLGVPVGGVVLIARQRRSRMDAERSLKLRLTPDGGKGLPRIGMLEASIVRARYRALEPSVLPLGSQIPTISRMEKATLVGGVARQTPRARPPDWTLTKSQSRPRTETSRLAITVSQSNNQRAKERSLLESRMFPALPPYPGSPLTRQ